MSNLNNLDYGNNTPANVNADADDSVLDLDKVNRSDLARVTGVDLAHISRIFTHKRIPSRPLADAICDHLGIDILDFCAFLGVALEDMAVPPGYHHP